MVRVYGINHRMFVSEKNKSIIVNGDYNLPCGCVDAYDFCENVMSIITKLFFYTIGGEKYSSCI
jgi:hypothetical protein